MGQKSEPQNTTNTKKNELEMDESPEIIHHFTENPADLFLEIKMLEQRYDYTLRRIREKLNTNIKDVQKSKGDIYSKALNQRKNEIEKLITALENTIQANIQKIKTQEKGFIDDLEGKYKTKFKLLLDEVIGLIGYDF